MIRDIEELNFPGYATLTAATVTLADMGERTITATVKIDGEIRPDFSDEWAVKWCGERYVSTARRPQGSKGNESLSGEYELTFRHEAVALLQRYLFFEPASVGAGRPIADKWVATVGLNLGDFKDLLNDVLGYYYDGAIRAELSPDWVYDREGVVAEISYSTVWEVVCKLWELYGVHWTLEHDGEGYVIRIGYDTVDTEGHIFEYGWEGGLQRVERQVQSDDIRNILLGRGGSKNLPYRYFKEEDKGNGFRGDPDWVPELRNIGFTQLRGKTFRDYVRGWKTNPRRQLTEDDGTAIKDSSTGQALKVEAYDAELGARNEEYRRGHEDEKFDPVEYVRDDASVALYGELWGGLDDNEDIWPTIRGVEVEGLGRVDECVAVEHVTDEPQKVEESDVAETLLVKDEKATVTPVLDSGETREVEIEIGRVVVPAGKTGNVTVQCTLTSARDAVIFSEQAYAYARKGTDYYPAVGLETGEHKIVLRMRVENTAPVSATASVTYSAWLRTAVPGHVNGRTFDVWIKNVWGTEKKAGETDGMYAERVWRPILGDREGNEAEVVFTSGALGVSEDYKFKIVGMPVYDNGQQIEVKDAQGADTGDFYESHWRLTLERSDADLESTGVYVPGRYRQGEAGDHFLFLGIELPQNYVEWAEERLDAYKRDCLGEMSDIKPTWVVTVDKLRAFGAEGTEPLRGLLVPGASVLLRDKRLTTKADGTVEPVRVTVQSVTYTYGENLLPDIEVVLTDEYETRVDTIGRISSDIERLNALVGSISNVAQVVRTVGERLFVSRTHNDEAQGKVRFVGGIEAGNYEEGYRGGRIDGGGRGELESLVVRALAELVDVNVLHRAGSRLFASGLTGEGWRIQQGERGWELEVDSVTVRRAMTVMELIIRKVRSVGGEIVVSAANGRIKEVGTDADCYVLTMETADHGFMAGDLLRCQTFSGGTLLSYWVEVDSIGAEGEVYVQIDEFNTEHEVPMVGDECVQMGSAADAGRSNVVRISATEGDEPVVDVLAGIRSKSTEGCLRARLGGLGGITDSSFGARGPKGYGLYSDNAYLKGEFVLTTGEAVKTRFEIVEGSIEAETEAREALGETVALHTARLSVMADEIMAEVTQSVEGGELGEKIGGKISVSAGEVKAEVTDGLKRTGIDIESGRVTVRADEMRFTDTEGEVQALFERGKLNVGALEASDKVVVRKGGTGEQRVEIVPDEGRFGVNIYDGEGSLRQSITGDEHAGASDFFGDAAEGAVAMTVPTGGGNQLTAGKTAVSGVWQSATAVTVRMTGGTLKATATVTGGITGADVEIVCRASAGVELRLERSATADFSTVSGWRTIGSVRAWSTGAEVTDTVALGGRTASLEGGGYYRLAVVVTASATGGTATGAWTMLSAQKGAEVWMSHYYANGMALGCASDEYFGTHYTASAGMVQTMEAKGRGYRWSRSGQEGLFGGQWIGQPMLLVRGFAEYLGSGQGFGLKGYVGPRFGGSRGVTLNAATGRLGGVDIELSTEFLTLLGENFGEEHIFAHISSRSTESLRTVTGVEGNRIRTDSTNANFASFGFEIWMV